jgi:hypothetical protein
VIAEAERGGWRDLAAVRAALLAALVAIEEIGEVVAAQDREIEALRGGPLQ